MKDAHKQKKCLTKPKLGIRLIESGHGCDGSVKGRLSIMYVLIVYVLISFNVNNATADIGAEWNPTGNPIGGGPGYSDSVIHQDADFVVHNKSQLLSALSSASSDDIVYVWDTCIIDMTGTQYTSIPAGVTLASGRGRALEDTISWGALLFYNNPGFFNGDMFGSSSGGRMRVTGLRFRGSYSELEGYMVPSDSFAQGVPWEVAIGIHHDSCEVDNCEFWGFGKAAVNHTAGKGSYIHHNYIHHCRHVYYGYSIQFTGTSDGIVEACYFDDLGSCVAGSVDTTSSYEARFNISGRHGGANAYERHNNGGSPPFAGADYVHHNTVRFTGFSNYATGYVLCGGAVDSVLVHENWFWAKDSAHSFELYSDSLVKIWDNAFTETPPPGVSGRTPTASIVASADSGNPPLTVAFKATGSSDPDGELVAFYWHFGDSCKSGNWSRYTDIDDTVQYTYNEIGKYTVSLMVVDNDGIPSYAYKTINVKPINADSNYLSCWIKDKFHDRPPGYYSKQILINDWVCWEKDLAGNGSWEHVIINITDSLASWQSDSITLAFRLYCKRDTSDYSHQTKMYIDDVVIYGADVVNGDFESGNWTGTWKCTDGNWIPDCYHNGVIYFQYDWYLDTNGGIRAYHLGKRTGPHSAGNWSKVSQKVAIRAIGIDDTLHDENDANSDMEYNLYHPIPNPSSRRAGIRYQLPARSCVTLKVYDISGRLVKMLLDEEMEAGHYQAIWDGRDEIGKEVANGIYFFRLEAKPIDGGEIYQATRKSVVLKK